MGRIHGKFNSSQHEHLGQEHGCFALYDVAVYCCGRAGGAMRGGVGWSVVGERMVKGEGATK